MDQSNNPHSKTLMITNPMKTMIPAALAAAVLLLSADVLAADAPKTIYAQGFANNTNNTQKIAAYGWTWFRNGKTAAMAASANAISKNKGAKALKNVNAPAPNGDNILPGSLLLALNVPTIMAHAKPEAPIELTAYSEISLSVDIWKNGALNATECRFVIKVGPAFYASDLVYTQGKTSGKWETVSVKLSGDSKWVRLEGVPAKKGDVANLTIAGNPVALSTLGKTVETFGFHSTLPEKNAGQRGFDNFVVKGTVR
jgi:hypothetical protein